MTTKDEIDSLHRLFDVLDYFVGTLEQPWQERRKMIMKAASETDLANLYEFISWFDAFDPEQWKQENKK